MVETLTDSGAVKIRAGANVATLTPDQYTELINQAEAYINSTTRIDYVAAYSGLATDKKKILDLAASSHAAMGAINFDMSGYTSRAEALTMLNFNHQLMFEATRLLKEKEVAPDFIG